MHIWPKFIREFRNVNSYSNIKSCSLSNVNVHIHIQIHKQIIKKPKSISLKFKILSPEYCKMGSYGQIVTTVQIPRNQCIWELGYFSNGNGRRSDDNYRKDLTILYSPCSNVKRHKKKNNSKCHVA